MSPPERPALRHVPALDGIRGAGVAGILVFHAGYLDGGGLMSLGTAWETGYAHAKGKPIMTLGDPGDVNIAHLLLNGSADFHSDTVAEAVRAAVLLLTPGL